MRINWWILYVQEVIQQLAGVHAAPGIFQNCLCFRQGFGDRFRSMFRFWSYFLIEPAETDQGRDFEGRAKGLINRNL